MCFSLPTAWAGGIQPVKVSPCSTSLITSVTVTRCPAPGQPCQTGCYPHHPHCLAGGTRGSRTANAQPSRLVPEDRITLRWQRSQLPAARKPRHCFPASAPSSKPGRNVQPWPVAVRRDLPGWVCAAPGTASTTGAVSDSREKDQSSWVRYPGMTYRGYHQGCSPSARPHCCVHAPLVTS